MGLRLLILLGLCACSLAKVSKKRQDKPNIMWIFADDYGYDDIGYKNNMIKTPVMDKLAGDGIKLNNAYMAAQCTPSRTSFMTGRYVFKLGMQHSVIRDDCAQCVPLQYKMMPGYLKELGYNTHAIGKWHLGYCRDECLAQNRGFDTFFGGMSGEGDYFAHDTAYHFYDWWEGDQPCWDCNGTHSQELIKTRVNRLLSEEDGSDPWFMYVSFHNVHSVAEAMPMDMKQYKGLGLTHDRQAYLGLVTGMDRTIGSIVERLKKTGHYDNTIIVFSSDNGGDVHEANNLPLRGTKSTLWEGGVRAISWIHSPLMEVKGVESDELIHVTDWLPTFVSLAGGSVDTKAKGMDGYDISDIVLKNGQTERTNMVYNIDREYEHGPPSYGEIAVRNEQYKLMMGSPGQVDGYGIDGADFLCNIKEYQDMVANYTAQQNSVDKRGGPYYFTAEQNGILQSFYDMVQVTDEQLAAGTGYTKLYDLDADIGEHNDLSQSIEPEHVAAKEELLKMVQDLVANEYVPAPDYWNAFCPDPNFYAAAATSKTLPLGNCKNSLPLPDTLNTE